MIHQAIALLRGEGLPAEEADDQRERLLAGFRWILVDEYQDIDANQYELISALAGRTLEEDRKLTLFAVGDDDQNIYAFNGASVEFIRRFGRDYGPRPAFLVDNYRSTRHIITAANTLILPARDRMKGEHPIRIDRSRSQDPPGGAWEALDPVAKGRVQILPARADSIAQAQIAMRELLRLAALAPDWDWSSCAVIAREWKYLEPVRAFCEVHDIPVQMANEEIPSFWRLRETRALVEWMRARPTLLVDSAGLHGWMDDHQSPGPWTDLLREALDEHAAETGGAEVLVDQVIEWLAEWGRDIRRRQHGLMLSTAHRAKGLEFDHVAVLDGGWERRGDNEDPDAPRRLYYVAMTRARRTLALLRFGRSRGGSWPDSVQGTRGPCLRRALTPATACLSGERCGPLPCCRPRSAGSPGACPSLPATRSGRDQPGLRRSPARPASGASGHRGPVPWRFAGGAGGRVGALGAAGRRRNGSGASRQRLRASGGRAVQVRHRPRDRRVEPRGVGARLPGWPRV